MHLKGKYFKKLSHSVAVIIAACSAIKKFY